MSPTAHGERVLSQLHGAGRFVSWEIGHYAADTVSRTPCINGDFALHKLGYRRGFH